MFIVAESHVVPQANILDESATCELYLSCTNRVYNIVLLLLFIYHHMADYSGLCFFYTALDDVAVE